MAVPDNGVAVPPSSQKVPNSRKVGTTRASRRTVVRDLQTLFLLFCYKAGTTHAKLGTIVPRFQAAILMYFQT